MRQEEIRYILEKGGTVEQIMTQGSKNTRVWGLWIILSCFVLVLITFNTIQLTQEVTIPGQVEQTAIADEVIFTMMGTNPEDRPQPQYAILPHVSEERYAIEQIGEQGGSPQYLIKIPAAMSHLSATEKRKITLMGQQELNLLEYILLTNQFIK